MWSLLLIGIGLGLVDSLNPFTISAQIVLQPFVKKRHHVLYYIAGTYLSYFIGGVLVYWGIDKLISVFLGNIMLSYSTVVFSLEIALGAGLILFGIILLIKRINRNRLLQMGETVKEKEVKIPKSVNPVFLFFFGAVNTIGDLPTAFPYLIFIAKMIEANMSMPLVLFLIGVYCLVYVLPLILIYVLFVISKKKMDALIDRMKPKFSLIGVWAAILILAGIGVYLIVNGCMNLSA